MLEYIEVKRLSPNAILPTRAHHDDAGMDLYALDDEHIMPQQKQIVATGIAIAVPTGFFGLIGDRSSMAKRGAKVAGGVVDAGYRGEIKIVIWNLSNEVIQLKKGERIAQMMIIPIVTPAIQEVDILDETQRGLGGFGSSGR